MDDVLEPLRQQQQESADADRARELAREAAEQALEAAFPILAERLVEAGAAFDGHDVEVGKKSVWKSVNVGRTVFGKQKSEKVRVSEPVLAPGGWSLGQTDVGSTDAPWGHGDLVTVYSSHWLLPDGIVSYLPDAARHHGYEGVARMMLQLIVRHGIKWGPDDPDFSFFVKD